jgi:hypothetical protein
MWLARPAPGCRVERDLHRSGNRIANDGDPDGSTRADARGPPLLGIVLNGTSSVLYGTVPDLAPKGDIGRGFALFYTGVIGSGGLAPIAYGPIADHFNRSVRLLAAALTAAVNLPLVPRAAAHRGRRARCIGGARIMSRKNANLPISRGTRCALSRIRAASNPPLHRNIAI